MFKAVVMGAGSIGALKPNKYDSRTTNNILTMAHAFTEHPGTDLVAILDTDLVKAKRAAKKWGTKAYQYLHEVKGQVDIVAICIPTADHISAITLSTTWKEHKPKLIIGEKPFCENVDQARRAVKTLDELGIGHLIDYIRRFSIGAQEMKLCIDQNELGEIYHARVTYGRGFKHEACHAVDLMRYWFGEFYAGNILDMLDVIIDRGNSDPTMPVYMKFERCPHVLFMPVDGRSYSVFEIEVWGEKGRVAFVDHGKSMRVYARAEEKTYGNYMTLESDPLRFNSNLSRALLDLVDNAVGWLNDDELLLCTGEDAIAVHQIYDELFSGLASYNASPRKISEGN